MVEVTQEDRELLIELISFDSETIDAILAGNAFTWEVEQIARHRIAAMEEAAKVADSHDTGDMTREDQEASRIAAAIRALKGQTDDPA